MKRLLVVALAVVVLGGVSVVVWTRADRCSGVNVAVFLDPDMPVTDKEAVRAEIAEIEPEVVHMDQLEAYREFKEMFRHERDMPLVEPGDLPTSYRATLDEDDAAALQKRLLGRPNVETVQLWPCDDDLFRRPPPTPSGQT